MRAWLQQRAIWVETAVTVLCAFIIYSLTLAPGLTWENFGVDGGELITASVTLGVAHPPGYPTYVLLGKLFSLLPLGTMATRYNLFSAICTAAAAGAVTAAAHLQFKAHKLDVVNRGAIAVAVGLSVAFAELIWSQAVITEVYGLNLLLLALLQLALVGRRPSFLVGLLFGLSITTHLTSLFFAPLVLLGTPPKNWRFLAAGITFGLLPYLFIFGLARSGSPVNWGNAETVRGWWWLVSGQAYRGYLFALPLNQVSARFAAWGWALLNQLTLVGVLLLLFGGYAQWQSGSAGKRLVLGVGLTAVSLTGYAFSYSTADAIILLLPVLLVISPLLTAALKSVGKIALLLPLSLLLINFNSQNLQNRHDISRQGAALLHKIPSHAIVLTPGDATIFTLWYVQHIEEVRPDLKVVDSNLFAFNWYRQQLWEKHPQLEAVKTDDLEAFIANNKKNIPICRVSLAEAETANCASN